jgi:para-aminobenzoate synthetase/4-amino-4-deoxychorismate lyase
VLERVASSCAAGTWAAGFLTYEAAPAFDPAFRTHEPSDLPVTWFGIYDDCESIRLESFAGPSCSISRWNFALDRRDHARAVQTIRDLIESGDTYQVNLTLVLSASLSGEEYDFFRALEREQGAAHGAFVDTGRFVLCSASPELFFRMRGGRVTTRPTKATARRRPLHADDRQARSRLWRSEKERAENVMVVDMVRNDLGRIATPGSVRVSRLFDIETYPSIYQMTSTVEATTDADPIDVLRALFPSASITGAPKVRAMEIIQRLESTPRGSYTGAIGFIGPDRQAQFNVAIRTATIDRQTRRGEFGTGGAIVWDSRSESEWEECLAKASILPASLSLPWRDTRSSVSEPTAAPRPRRSAGHARK